MLLSFFCFCLKFQNKPALRRSHDSRFGPDLVISHPKIFNVDDVPARFATTANIHTKCCKIKSFDIDIAIQTSTVMEQIECSIVLIWQTPILTVAHIDWGRFGCSKTNYLKRKESACLPPLEQILSTPLGEESPWVAKAVYIEEVQNKSCVVASLTIYTK